MYIYIYRENVTSSGIGERHCFACTHSGRKITASFGNVTVSGGKRYKGQGGSKVAKSLSEHV
jgi:hypothetical protein